MKSRHRAFSNVLKTSLILLTLVMLVLTTLFIINLTQSNPNNNGLDDDEKTSAQTFTFKLEDYTLYRLDELDFDVIVAELSVTSNRAINLSLSHFETSERIQLNNVDRFLEQFEKAGYFFKNQNIVFSLNSLDTQMRAHLFIPVTDRTLSELVVQVNLNPRTTLRFPIVNSNFGSATDLGFNQDSVTPDMIAQVDLLSKSMVSSSEFYQLDANGLRVEANFTSQSQIIGVKLRITNKSSIPFRLTRAVIKATSTDFYDAVDDSYRIDGVRNLGYEYINDVAEGYLFFEVLGSELDLRDFMEIDIYLSSTRDDKFYALRFDE